ncbi:hypothetical protein PV433_11370 [Paenibacillus sp. GYB004]|uniref:hypothetical protein n=1 Tax=Paenibacillus sp. GYB004 TaxID=2994393 RepID=UPI002F96D2A5
MSEYFYGHSPQAVMASKSQMIENAERLKAIISNSGHDIELVAVNKYYKSHCVCRFEGQLYVYAIYENQIRRENEFRGYGGDAWEQAPNLVQLKDLDTGQMEMF